MSEKAMVLFSGGVDSTTCLGLAIEKYGVQNVIPLSSNTTESKGWSWI